MEVPLCSETEANLLGNFLKFWNVRFVVHLFFPDRTWALGLFLYLLCVRLRVLESKWVWQVSVCLPGPLPLFSRVSKLGPFAFSAQVKARQKPFPSSSFQKSGCCVYLLVLPFLPTQMLETEFLPHTVILCHVLTGQIMTKRYLSFSFWLYMTELVPFVVHEPLSWFRFSPKKKKKKLFCILFSQCL